jgi:lipid-A-disaccharide synthase
VHAASLISALKRQQPAARVAAVGGERCRAVADEFVEDLASRGVTGFWEPLVQVGFLRRLSARLDAILRERRPAAVVCVDYYGFNRRVLALAARHGVPAFYFISPQVWASRPARVEVLKRYVRRMIVIFPFEERLYREAGVPVTFVGHPLLDAMPAPNPRSPEPNPRTSEPSNSGWGPAFLVTEAQGAKVAAGPSEAGPVIGLLPGSRQSELRRHLPLCYDAFTLLRAQRPSLRGVLFAASQQDEEYGVLPAGVTLVRDPDYRVRATLDAAICSSGTATLENALLGVPMVVIYKLSWLTYRIARAIVTVKHIAMANVLAGRAIVPELIQDEATPSRVAEELGAILDDPARAARMRTDLLALRESLGEPGATERAARVILKEIQESGIRAGPGFRLKDSGSSGDRG